MDWPEFLAKEWYKISMKKKNEYFISKYILIGTAIGPSIGVMFSSIFFENNSGVGMLYGTAIGILVGLVIGLIKYKKMRPKEWGTC